MEVEAHGPLVDECGGRGGWVRRDALDGLSNYLVYWVGGCRSD